MPATLVARPMVNMDASGEGVVEAFNYTNAAHTGITHVFTVNAAEDHNLFKSIQWQDDDTEGDLDASSGAARVNLTYNVSQFAESLASLLAGASGFYVGGGVTAVTSRSSGFATPTQQQYQNKTVSGTIRDVLDKEVRREVELELDNNNVLEYFEGDSLGEFSLRVDYSGGAAAMADRMSEMPNLRNLFFQIPNRQGAVSLLDASGDRLPVMSGDSVVFVFHIVPRVDITENARNDPDSADGANATTGTTTNSNLQPTGGVVSVDGVNYGAGSSISYAVTAPSATANDYSDAITFITGSRKIALVINVTAAV
jgi:hypothetical protein